MLFAYDYPILGLFWTMFMFFLFFAWLMLLFRVFGDIFRNKTTSGWTKGFWSIFVILLPFLGVLIYLFAHGNDMAERDVAQAQASEAEFQSYVQQAAGSGGGTASELTALADLHKSGMLTDEEFAQQKAKLLA